MAQLTNAENIAALKEMTILELNELVKTIEEEFGVTAAAPTVVAAAAVEEAVDEGPAEVSVFVTDVGASKVKVIKAVQTITGLGLMDAKKLVDALPAKIKENVSPAEADSIKAQLVEAGAVVDVK